MCPDESVFETACGSKKGKFQDLKQRVGLGVKRSERDSLLSLFEWNEEEEKELEELPWNSSREGCMANRKYRHLMYLFEAAHSVCINPSLNVTQNPTSKWQLKHYE